MKGDLTRALLAAAGYVWSGVVRHFSWPFGWLACVWGRSAASVGLRSCGFGNARERTRPAGDGAGYPAAMTRTLNRSRLGTGLRQTRRTARPLHRDRPRGRRCRDVGAVAVGDRRGPGTRTACNRGTPALPFSGSGCVCAPPVGSRGKHPRRSGPPGESGGEPGRPTAPAPCERASARDAWAPTNVAN
jgi:hypothetical protein